MLTSKLRHTLAVKGVNIKRKTHTTCSALGEDRTGLWQNSKFKGQGSSEVPGNAGDRRRQAVPGMQRKGGKDLAEGSKAGGSAGNMKKKAETLSPVFNKKIVFVHTGFTISQPYNCILR